jgi:hypothetical protein
LVNGICDQSQPTERGPKPYPDWLITDLAAVDTELGVLKTGKEADVFLLRRGVPGTGRECLLAAKRYRDSEHRMFHRDSGYLEGRRTRESRVNRAIAGRTSFGREAIAGQWAYAEFAALTRLYAAGVPVPYPVQILGTELLLEFIGDAAGDADGDTDGTAAPRLAETRRSSASPARQATARLATAKVAMAAPDGRHRHHEPLESAGSASAGCDDSRIIRQPRPPVPRWEPGPPRGAATSSR